MQPGRQVPTDFVAFVEAHTDRLTAACQELTSNPTLATALRRDLLAAVALRWWWFRRRSPRHASAYLSRLLRREARSWPSDPVSKARPGRIIVADAAPHRQGRSAGTTLADDAWARAARLRTSRRVAVAVALTLVLCVVSIGPRQTQQPQPEPTPPTQTAVPADVLLLPPIEQLDQIASRATWLPILIDADPDAAVALTETPLVRAVAAIRLEQGPLLVVAENGTTRRVDSPALASARFLTTSLSPDGTRIALLTSTGLLIAAVDSGVVTPLRVNGVRPGATSLTWISRRHVLLPTVTGSVDINIDTGKATDINGVTGLDVASVRGQPPAKLIELIPISTARQSGVRDGRGRIRIWHTMPADTDQPGVEDRPVFGPAWIGSWTGPGWATTEILVRACATRTLPDAIPTPRSAIAAVGANGLYAGTLVVVDASRLDLLGYLDHETVLVAVSSPQAATTLIAWTPREKSLRRVARVTDDVSLSMADVTATR